MPVRKTEPVYHRLVIVGSSPTTEIWLGDGRSLGSDGGGQTSDRSPTGSYGFQPGRSQHDALDALATALTRTKVNWILDADIRSFFDSVSHDWLVRFVEHRIGDPRVIRLLRKWLEAGVMEEGVLTATKAGTPQGAVASPLLANIYLHYVFDLWAQRWRQHHARGKVIFVRYADDIVAGFEHEADAKRFHVDFAHAGICAGGAPQRASLPRYARPTA